MTSAITVILLFLPFFLQRREITKSAKNIILYCVFAAAALGVSLAYALNPYGRSIFAMIYKLINTGAL